MDKLEQGKFVHILVDVDTDDKVKWGISSVDHLVLSVFEEGALLDKKKKISDQLGYDVQTYLILCTWEAFTDKFTFESDTLLHWEAIIVLWEAGLPLLVDH